MKQITNHFRATVIFLLIFLPWQAHSQLNEFPYAQSFEGSFSLGDSVQFLPYWWANEVAENKRVFQDFSFPHSGAAAMALQTTSSFRPKLQFHFNGSALPEGIISFYLANRQNGGGTRPVLAAYRFSADGGTSWTEGQPIGPASGFVNEDGAYELFSLQLPPEIQVANRAIFELQLRRGEGEGSTASLLLDDFLLEDGAGHLRFLGVEVLSSTQLLLTFNQPLATSALAVGHYQLLPSVEIKSIDFGSSAQEIALETEPLQPEVSYSLSITELASQSGSSLEKATANFTYVPLPAFQDIIITEIFPDPNPKGLLPEQPVLPTDGRAEFIELYNRSAAAWPMEKLVINGQALSEGQLLPNAYVVLCSPDFVPDYSRFGQVIGVASWKILPNEAGSIYLTYAEKLIDSVNYSKSWHSSSDKASGGWSLEKQLLHSQCNLATDWTSSENAQGASPGRENSVINPALDTLPPALVQALQLSDSSLLLVFTEAITPSSFSSDALQLAPAVPVQSLTPVNTTLRQWQVVLTNAWQGKSVKLAGNLTDCTGNVLKAADELPIEKVIRAGAGELQLSEIMYDPGPEGVEYIELYNNTGSWLQADGWQLERGDKVSLFSDFTLIPPKGYRAFGRNNSKGVFASRLSELAIPNLPNDGDTIRLVNKEGELMEYMVYADAMHTPLLSNTQGTSLERLCLNLPARQASNWSSAAALGSPGVVNSQGCPDSLVKENSFWVKPDLIFPASTVYPSKTSFYYRLKKSPATGNLQIFTPDGQLVKELVNNELLASEGEFSWNGKNQEGRILSMGYYIAVLRLTYADGSADLHRCSLVIGKKMK